MRKITVFSLCMLAGTAMAGETTGEVSAGYQSASGNSQSSALNGLFRVGYESDRWEDRFELKGSQEKDDREVSGERYSSMGKVAYNITEFDYFFNEASYSHDRFGGIRKSVDDAVGYGRRLLKTDKQNLDVQLGVGYRHQTTQNPERERNNETIGTGGVDYRWKITDNSKFSEKVRVKAGSDNTNWLSETELKLRIYQQLSATLAYTIDYNSDVPTGVKHADRYTSINLTYDFGG